MGMALLLTACAGIAPAGSDQAMATEGERLIVAVRDDPEPMPTAGATPRSDYRLIAGYAGSVRSAALAAEVAEAHGLTEQAFWTIDPLHLRCAVYSLKPGVSGSEVLARLQKDPRVQLAQPVNQFETLAEPGYNDPYLKLQHGFAAMGAADAHRASRGEGVVVAVIDTAVDAAHPDLAGRVASSRDFTGGAHPVTDDEKHGTEVAGVIAATANNRLGIVGMAPAARVLAYRACWAAPVAGTARCDSFTLARAMGAAITAQADVINLSLGGPADPLLEQLVGHAIRQGAIVVGAVPPGGRLDGFPLNVPGVLAVALDEGAARSPRMLAAPGRDVLTLVPGGHYDYASGSSLAAAHVTGAVALLRALDPRMGAEAVQALLLRHPGTVDACAAVRRLRPEVVCQMPAPHD
jgi:subtilisin family serine protease